MKKIIIFVVIAMVIIAVAYWYFIYRPSHNLSDGQPCKNGILPGVIKNGTCVYTPVITPLPITINLNFLLNKSVKVIDQKGAVAYDLDSNACLTQKNPQVIIPNAMITPILEAKQSACAGSVIIRTAYGWLSIQSNSIQII